MIDQKTHERVRKEAIRRSIPVWQVTRLLLNYSLDAVKSGDLKLTGPSIETP